MTDIVLGRIEDGVAVVTLNRPEASNAMSMELADALYAVIEPYSRDNAVRAWLINSNGKNFCAGGDISIFGDAKDPGAMIRALATRLHDSLKLLQAHRAPVVMAIQGAAAGAGFSLVSSADIAIAGQSSSYLWAYAALGLTCDGGSTWNLPRVIGMRKAQELAFTGKRILADEAAAIGLVTRVVEDAALQDEALAVAKQIAQGPTTSYGEVKKLLAATYANDFATQLDAEANSIAAALVRPDGANAVRAFLEKRKPVFTGE
ncbi:MAG TPA: enoyl-CoA hydratase-related protein [Sphingobium sp.]|uniref:enoyl-CoA hydratase/isomerase family protein n=1 Tax=Sphingobium sp. TaxID=1912891 RepID=UPI002ED448D9